MSNLTDNEVLYYFNNEEIQTFIDKIDYTFASAVVASLCFLISIINLLILISSSFFRKYNKILIALALASIISLISMAYQNYYQFDQYRTIITFGFIPQKTSWDCAILTWVWLKLIADLWPPSIQAMMGIERAIAVYRPAYYRKIFAQRINLQLSATVVFVAFSITVAYGIAALNVVPGFATCGRKNAFSREFGVYLYLVNIFGYLISFILSFIAFIKAQGTSLPSKFGK
uniref:G-protein coupled receptors family 1 profile domain-containing protein n=1 Tax=Panagrolaimus sp. ES5 TaxID=591445 RepID=A0AC34GP89_9BILA